LRRPDRVERFEAPCRVTVRRPQGPVSHILPGMSHVPAKRRGRLRSLVVDLEPVRRDRDFRMLWLGDVGAATVAAVAGTQFSVVSGGVL
jgi:hypothetical protein